MKENINELVAKELKVLRVENDMTTKELADKTGVASSTISYYENQKTEIALGKLQQILSAYDLSLLNFFARILAKKHN